MMKRLVVTINEDQHKKLLQLKEQRGLFSVSELMRSIITEAYKRDNPPYVSARQKLTPEEKARERVALHKLQQELIEKDTEDTGMRLCELLKGEVINEGSYLACKFKMYEQMNSNQVHIGEMKLPLEELTEEIVSKQYRDMEGKTGEQARLKCQEILNLKTA